MTSAYLYLRVSTDDKGQNPENQEHSCRELAAANGFEVIEVFTEEKSAWQSYNRPVFDAMLDKAKRDGVKIIIVWDYDRVYRDRKKLLELVGTYKKLYGIKIYSVRQRFMEDLLKLDGTIGELVYDVMLNFFGWIAEEESRKKSERVKLAVTTKYGKTVSKAGKKWGRPSLSDYYKKQITDMKAGGKTTAGIARELKMSETTIRKYLKSTENTKAQNEGITSKNKGDINEPISVGGGV
jgi:DNA invertase Pin-like site-specific DNA recombinase